MVNLTDDAIYFLNSETQVNIITTSALTSETTTTTVNKNLTYNTGKTLETAMTGFKNLYNALSTDSVNNVDLTLNKEYTDLLNSGNVKFVDDSGTVITTLNVTFTPKEVQGASGVYLGSGSFSVDAPEDCVVLPWAVSRGGIAKNDIGGIVEVANRNKKFYITILKVSNDTRDFRLHLRVFSKTNWVNQNLEVHPIIQE